jgi:hypothetical protein
MDDFSPIPATTVPNAIQQSESEVRIHGRFRDSPPSSRPNKRKIDLQIFTHAAKQMGVN